MQLSVFQRIDDAGQTSSSDSAPPLTTTCHPLPWSVGFCLWINFFWTLYLSVISLFHLNHVFKVHPCYTMRYIYQNFILSLWLNNWVYGDAMLCLSINSVDRYLGCSWFGAIMNDNFMNIHAQVFIWTYVLGSLGIARSYGNSMFNFLGDFQDHSFCILGKPKWKMAYARQSETGHICSWPDTKW